MTSCCFRNIWVNGFCKAQEFEPQRRQKKFIYGFAYVQSLHHVLSISNIEDIYSGSERATLNQTSVRISIHVKIHVFSRTIQTAFVCLLNKNALKLWIYRHDWMISIKIQFLLDGTANQSHRFFISIFHLIILSQSKQSCEKNSFYFLFFCEISDGIFFTFNFCVNVPFFKLTTKRRNDGT